MNTARLENGEKNGQKPFLFPIVPSVPSPQAALALVSYDLAFDFSFFIFFSKILPKNSEEILPAPDVPSLIVHHTALSRAALARPWPKLAQRLAVL